MKIMFVYPAISDCGFNTEKRPVIFNQVHHGLCYLSAVCKKEGFTDVSLVDLRSLDGWNAFRETVAQASPDVAGVTLMSPDYKYAVKCLEIIKGVNPRIKTVVGGMHPTIMPEEMEKNANVDHVIVGEGEIVFPELLRCLRDGRPAERVIRGERPDVDEVPFADRELFDCLEMPYDFFLPLPFVTVLAGRGCAYNCKFCSPASKIMHGPSIRQRSVDNVISELKYLRDTYGFKSMMFWDDCFTEYRDWVMEFCDKYEENGFDQPFVCQTRADIICDNPDMMRRLKKAGLVMASIGFESGNDRMLGFINKGTTLRQNLEAARVCKRLGIKIWAYNMFGFPTETNSEALDTVRMIKRIKPYRSSAAFFTPHPGSTFYEYCKKRGLSLIDDHDDFVSVPEKDKPKIKDIDYDFMRKMAVMSKELSPGTRLRIKVEKKLSHGRNKAFRLRFQEELGRGPCLNKTAVLRVAHQAGRI